MGKSSDGRHPLPGTGVVTAVETDNRLRALELGGALGTTVRLQDIRKLIGILGALLLGRWWRRSCFGGLKRRFFCGRRSLACGGGPDRAKLPPRFAVDA